MNQKICQTIVDAYNYLVTQCNYGTRTYKQHIQRGSFENEQTVYRLQLPPLMLRIDEPVNFLYLPKTLTIGMIEDYYNNYITNGTVQPNETYTYGERIQQQLGQVLEILRTTSNTNQAVISISQPSDIDLHDPPCLRSIAFSLFGGRLHLTSYWRSNDIGEAFLLNQGGLGLLLKDVCEYTGLKIGHHYYCSSGSHLYIRS